MHFSVSVGEHVSSHNLHIQLARWLYTHELLCRLSRLFCSCCKPDLQGELEHFPSWEMLTTDRRLLWEQMCCRKKSDAKGCLGFFIYFFGFKFLCLELSLAFSRTPTHDTVLSHQDIVCIYKCFFSYFVNALCLSVLSLSKKKGWQNTIRKQLTRENKRLTLATSILLFRVFLIWIMS